MFACRMQRAVTGSLIRLGTVEEVVEEVVAVVVEVLCFGDVTLRLLSLLQQRTLNHLSWYHSKAFLAAVAVAVAMERPRIRPPIGIQEGTCRSRPPSLHSLPPPNPELHSIVVKTRLLDPLLELESKCPLVSACAIFLVGNNMSSV